MILFFTYLLFPIITTPLIFLAYYRSSRHTWLYSLLLAISLGLLAYSFSPPKAFDLYRHHQSVLSLSSTTGSDLLEYAIRSNEPVVVFIEYLVSQMKNVRLLQLLVVSVGYWLLLYVYKDYSKKMGIRQHAFMLTLLFTLSSFVFINFASGLWNYLAMSIFAFAFYIESLYPKNKKISYLLYALTPLIHLSMFMPIAALFVFRISKERVGRSFVILSSLFLASAVIMIPLTSLVSSLAIFSKLQTVYTGYFLTGQQFTDLYAPHILAMELLKLIPYVLLIAYYLNTSDRVIKNTAGYLLLLTSIMLIMAPGSLIILRFITLIQFIGGLLLLNFLSSEKAIGKSAIVIYIALTSAVFGLYQYSLLTKLDFNTSLKASSTMNISKLIGNERE